MDISGNYSRIFIVLHYGRNYEEQAQNSKVSADGEQLYESRQYEYY